jgi:hypothetical protein
MNVNKLSNLNWKYVLIATAIVVAIVVIGLVVGSHATGSTTTIPQ